MTTISSQTINLSKLASLVQAEKYCIEKNNPFAATHSENIDSMLEALPHGSGIDNGVKLLKDECDNDKLVFSLSYHHMDGLGSYDGWSDHKVIVKPSLIHGFTIHITGKDRNGIKDYLGDVFAEIFTLSEPSKP